MAARVPARGIGEDGAFRRSGERRRALGVGVAHTDDRRVLHPQRRVGIERRVPVRYPDQGDAHDFLSLVSCMLTATRERGNTMAVYEEGRVRIHYQEAGSGFP